MNKKSNHLGGLELQVMELLWEKGSMTVREFCEREEAGGRAYTTIMTTMDRLYQKGLLCREKDGIAYRYSPSQDRDSYWQVVAHKTIQKLMHLGGVSTLMAFVDAAADDDEANLDLLEEMIIQRQKERGESS